MRIFRAIPGWVSALAAACLVTSAVALAAPEAGKPRNENAMAEQVDQPKTDAEKPEKKRRSENPGQESRGRRRN